MNAKVIEAMKGIRDNLTIIIEEMETPVTAEATEVVEAKKETPVTPASMVAPTAPKSRKEREASEKLPNPNDELTQEQLDGLSYNNLKRLAKEMGIPAVGSRDELTQKILSYDGEVPNPDAKSEETETEEPVEEKKTSRKSPRKIQKSEPEPVEEEDDDDEEEVDPIVEKVNEAVEDMTDEEIMDILADVGVKAKGKRQALISAVIKAVRDGKIDLDDEESEEDEDEAETEAESEETEYDVNDPENPDMTEERRNAIKAYEADIRADFKNGDITRKQLVEWLNEFHDTKDTMKKKSDEEILNEYIYCSCLLINDEGEMPEEEGAYTVNGDAYCCGHALAYNEDNNTYICEVCGAEYEAGEE